MVQSRRTHVFVVRIWNDGHDSAQWRGSIRSVSDNQKVYFDSCDKVFGFLKTKIGIGEVILSPENAPTCANRVQAHKADKP